MTVPLVGREDLRPIVRRAVFAAAAGTGDCLVLEGPAGIGKSRLLATAVDDAEELGLTVAWGGSTELDRVAPLASLLAGLRRCQPPVLEESSLSGLSQHDDGRFWLVDRIGEGLEDYARARPLLIVLDDVQWADELTALALRILVPALRSSPVLFLLARRPAPIRHAGQDAVDWLIAEGARRLTLGPLSAEAMAEFCTEVLGAPPGPSVLSLTAASGGNPFLLGEILRTLQADGRVHEEGGLTVTLGGELPVSFVAAVDQRLRVLSDAGRRLLEAGAVLSRPFTLHEAGALLHLQIVDLMTATREAVYAGTLVDAGTTLAFRHDLIREAIHDGMPGAIRQALHREAATVLQLEGKPTPEVAEHFVEGGLRGDHAIAVLCEAIRQVAPTAPGAAADLVLRVLDLMDQHDATRLHLVADAVRLLASAGRLVEARQLGESCLRQEPEGPAVAEIVLGLAEALKHAGQDRAVVDYVNRALRGTTVPAREQAHLLAIQAHALLQVDEVDKVEDVGAKAVAFGKSVYEHSAVVFGNVARSVAAFARGDLDAAVGLAEEAFGLADTAAGVARQRHPGLWLARVMVTTDRLEEAASLFDAEKQASDELGTAWSRPLWHHFRADLQLATGNLDDAEAEAEAGVRVAEQIAAMALTPPLLATLAQVATRRGDLDAADALLRRAEDKVRSGIGVISEELYWEVALYEDAAGRPDAAVETLSRLYDALPGRLYLFVHEPGAGAQLVRMALAAECPERAAAAAAASRLAAERNPTVASLVAAAAHAEGLLRGDVEKLREAVAAFRKTPRRLCRASAMEDAAGAEIAAGHTPAAIALLDEALSNYADCAAKRDVARVQRRLDAIGGRKPRGQGARRAKTGWHSLTPFELRVVRLVAEGHTNREVASRLHLSPHTVDSHIRHSFAKLGVSSRVGLTRQVLVHDIT